MPLNIRISIDGINEVRRELDRIDARISNTAPFWRSVAVPIIKGKLRDIFLQEGPGWAPLEESTLRTRRYEGLPILQQTGDLKSSLLDDPVLQISRNELLFGTNNPYAPFHEHGTRRMPARPFLRPAIREAINEIQSEYIQYIAREIRRRV